MSRTRSVAQPYDPVKMERIVTSAINDPGLYPDPRDLLIDLHPHSGNGSVHNLDNKYHEMGLSVFGLIVKKKHHATFHTIDTLVKHNAFSLPTTVINNNGEEVDVKDWFYRKFGYFEHTPENIRKEVDALFAKKTAYDGKGFLRALIEASGWSGESAFLSALNYSETHFTKDFGYKFMLKLIDPETNPLQLRKNGTGHLDRTQIDALFDKFGFTHWREDKLQDNAREKMLGIRKEPPRFFEAARMLLPVDFVSSEILTGWMLATLPIKDAPQERRDFSTPLRKGRLNMLLAGNNGFGEAEREALLEIIESQTGISLDDVKFLRTLNTEQKLNARDNDINFHKKLKSMIMEHFLVIRHNGPSYLGSIEEFSKYMSKPSHAYAMQRQSAVVTFQLARAAVEGFETFAKTRNDLKDKIDADIAELLSHTPYSRTDLAKNACQVVEDFDETAPPPKGKSRIGHLLDCIRSSQGFDAGIYDLPEYANDALAAKKGLSIEKLDPDTLLKRTIVSVYLQNTLIPVKEDPRAKIPAGEDDNLDKLLAGINLGLREAGQRELEKDHIAKIRRIAAAEYSAYKDLTPAQKRARAQALAETKSNQR